MERRDEGRVGFSSTLAKLKLYPLPILPISIAFFIHDSLPFWLKYPCHPFPLLHSSLPIRPLHTLMSPAALQQQHAAVLHGPKDLSVDSRTLWPPQQGQAQVAVVSTGLCGSDCTFSPLPATPTILHAPLYKYTITSTAVTVIMPSNLP
jgi:hypothetical protein